MESILIVGGGLAIWVRGKNASKAKFKIPHAMYQVSTPTGGIILNYSVSSTVNTCVYCEICGSACVHWGNKECVSHPWVARKQVLIAAGMPYLPMDC